LGERVSESIYIEAGLEIESANSYVILDLDVSCISVENLSSVHKSMTGRTDLFYVIHVCTEVVCIWYPCKGG